MEIQTDAFVAVIGAGTMGAGIAQTAAAAGHHVVVVDTNAAALENGRAIIDASLAKLVGRGKLTTLDKTAVEDREG